MDELEALEPEALIAEAQRIERQRAKSIEESGRVLAELHERCGMSWPQIAAATDIAMTTVYRRARPYLRRSDDL